MPLRVVINLCDLVTSVRLAEAFEAIGHDVSVINDPSFVVPPRHDSKQVEIVIFRSKGNIKGLSFQLIGLGEDGYKGVFGAFMAEPITIVKAMETLRLFSQTRYVTPDMMALTIVNPHSQTSESLINATPLNATPLSETAREGPETFRGSAIGQST